MLMRMPRLIKKAITFTLFCSLIGSCSSNYRIDTNVIPFLKMSVTHSFIGISIYANENPDFYLIRDGKPERVKSLPKPPVPSHQNPELSSEGYDFLPKNISYRYIGPQLTSPDGYFTIASCINKNGPTHPANIFLIIDNKSKTIIHSESYDNKDHFTINGIAWSPKSDIFVLLTSQSTIPFQNPLRYFSGHAALSRDYYLLFYKRNGQLLFRKEIISSLVDGFAEVIWIDTDPDQ